MRRAIASRDRSPSATPPSSHRSSRWSPESRKQHAAACSCRCRWDPRSPSARRAIQPLWRRRGSRRPPRRTVTCRASSRPLTRPPLAAAAATGTERRARRTSAVTTPSRISAGGLAVRASRSQAMRKAPPATALAGSSVRCPGPSSRRTACGTTRPTNPTRPAAATDAPVSSAEVTRTSRLAASTSTPSAAAVSSPSSSRSSVRHCSSAEMMPIATNGPDSQTCAHVRESSPPIIQNTISCATCQVTMFSESSRLESAVRNAPTAMPVEQQRRHRRDAIARGDRVHQRQRAKGEHHRRQRQRRQRQRAPPRHEHRDGAEHGPRSNAGQARLGERIAEQALHQHAGGRQPRADDRGDEDPRQPHQPDDRDVGAGDGCRDRPSPRAAA